MKKNIPSSIKTAFALTIFLAAVFCICLVWILSANFSFPTDIPNSAQITADIYQDGILIECIDLSAVTESYRFTITGENNCRNEIEVRPGGIGIISADCPDKLCVHQGFITSNLLPITCLPNRLVIQIRTEEITTDIITY